MMVKLYHQDGTLLEKLKVKKPAQFIMYRGFLYKLTTSDVNKMDRYVQVPYVEVS